MDQTKTIKVKSGQLLGSDQNMLYATRLIDQIKGHSKMVDNLIHDKEQLTKLISLINGGYMKSEYLDLRHMEGEKLHGFK